MLKGLPVKLIHGFADTKATPTSVPAAPELSPFHSFGCAAPMATHSITSSARASNGSGTSIPRARAVFRLIASSYLVGACTGRSLGRFLHGDDFGGGLALSPLG